MAAPLWVPAPGRMAGSTLRAYLDWLERREGRSFPDHDSFWAWSVAELDRFWTSIGEYFEVPGLAAAAAVRVGAQMPDVRWFPGARLNWAQYLLRGGADDEPALLCVREGGHPAREISWGELRAQVASVAAWLRAHGVQPGDRVGAYLPNTEHAVIACLATAAVGAVWACCSPDFGADGTIARLVQLEPTVLIATDGYHWNGREIDRRDVVERLTSSLPTVRHIIRVPYLFSGTSSAAGACQPADRLTSAPAERRPAGSSVLWAEVVAGEAAPRFEQVEFSHPLWVLFSSGTTGTTGAPKGLVQGHGGILLENLKWAGIYGGLRPGSRGFVFTSTGWVLWNIQLAMLTQQAAVVLYEGSPVHPAPDAVWEVAARLRAELVFVGAALVTAVQNAGLSPREKHDLSALRSLLVSGSPLPTEGYRFVYEHIAADVRLDSCSGGTDVCTGFVGGNDLLPVHAGQIAGPLAGVAVAAWNDAGEPVVDEVGELVVTEPMPSMPLYLWADPDGTRYRDSYFDTWPGVWRHGDWITMHPDHSVVIHGRSDATLNRDGVRLGSSEFYDVVEPMPQVREALVVGVEEGDGGYYLPLFLAMAEGHELTDALRDTIATTLRARLTPRHVPDEIVAVPAIPHTLTGKKLEVPVKRLLAGAPPEKVANPAAVDAPEALAWFADFAATRR